MKKLILSALILCSSVGASAQALGADQCAIFGLLGGMYIGKNYMGQPQNVVIVQQSPIVYPRPNSVTVVTPDQLPMYNQDTHGYCAGYHNEAYAYCLGNVQRMRNEEAYRRGLGY